MLFSILGSVKKNILKDSLGKNLNGQEVFMKDVWPANNEVEQIIQEFYRAETFREKYDQVFDGGDLWEKLSVSDTENYN